MPIAAENLPEYATVGDLEVMLKALQDDVDRILSHLDPETCSGWPINLADLSCTFASWGLNQPGGFTWLVCVEEASPGDGRFAQWLENQLRPAWGDVAVMTEW